MVKIMLTGSIVILPFLLAKEIPEQIAFTEKLS